MAAVAPAPGSLNPAPVTTPDFAGLAPAPPAPVLATCYAVTAGPDRHLYWVYAPTLSTATAINTPVPVGCCFETRDSIVTSQGKRSPRQRCRTCNRSLALHMTAAQATAA